MEATESSGRARPSVLPAVNGLHGCRADRRHQCWAPRVFHRVRQNGVVPLESLADAADCTESAGMDML